MEADPKVVIDTTKIKSYLIPLACPICDTNLVRQEVGDSSIYFCPKEKDH